MKRNQSQKVFRFSEEQKKEQQTLSNPLSSNLSIRVILIFIEIVIGIIALAIWVNSYRRIRLSYDTYVTSINKFLEEVGGSESTTQQPTQPQQPTDQQPTQLQQPTVQQSQPTQGEPIVINNNIYVSGNTQVTPSED